MSGVLSSQKQNKLRRIVSTWQRFARARKASNQGTSASLDSGPRSHTLPDEKTFVVFVGKERRQYVLGEHYLSIPLFRSLLEKSKSSPDHGTLIPCEVVMFEHLLWMLDSGNPATESVEELLDLYSY